jgi:hypothetical protein
MPVRCYGFCEKHIHHRVFVNLASIPDTSILYGLQKHLVPCSGSSSSTSAYRSANPSLKNVTVLTAEGRGRAHDGRRPSIYSGVASMTMPRDCVLCRAATCGKVGSWRPGSSSSGAFQCLCERGQEDICKRSRRSSTVIFSNRIRSRYCTCSFFPYQSAKSDLSSLIFLSLGLL